MCYVIFEWAQNDSPKKLISTTIPEQYIKTVLVCIFHWAKNHPPFCWKYVNRKLLNVQHVFAKIFQIFLANIKKRKELSYLWFLVWIKAYVSNLSLLIMKYFMKKPPYNLKWQKSMNLYNWLKNQKLEK